MIGGGVLPQLRWTMIGASDIAATRMIPALRACGQSVTRVYSSDPHRVRAFAAANSIPEPTAVLDQALASGIDAVYISSMNDQHAEHVRAAAEARVHVFCEKPLATTLADAGAMIDACRSARVVLATNHHLRNSAAIRRIRALVGAGALGDVRSARIQHGVLLAERLRTWRLTRPDGGGVIFDLGVHDADTLRFVLNRRALEVTALAVSQQLGTGTVEDAVVSTQLYDGGVVVSAHDSFCTPFAGSNIEIHGTDATLLASDVLRPDSVGDLHLVDRRGRLTLPVGQREDPYESGVRAFVGAAVGVGRPVADGVDGACSLAVALAIRESVASRRAVRVAYASLGGGMASDSLTY